MAKVKFSALISEMRNKLNGSVFARNRGGAYLRTKVTPVNPQTIAQVLARSLLTSFSQSWRSLTQPQRDAWNSVVDQWATTDVFGDVQNPSGQNLYIRLNINISIAGGSPLLLPPSPAGAAALTVLALASDSALSTLDVTFAPDPVPTDHAMVVDSTPNLSPGISNASAKFRTIDVVAAAATSPASVGPEQVAKFGPPTAGQKIFVRAKLINMNTGEVSQRLQASIIVS